MIIKILTWIFLIKKLFKTILNTFECFLELLKTQAPIKTKYITGNNQPYISTSYDNKRFWKTIKPYFSDKGINSHKLILIENDSILTNEMSLAKLMNNYFINITNDLELKLDVLTNTNINLPSIIENYKNHLSITKIRSTWNGTLPICYCFSK